jgi:hypothetical protein
MRLPTLLEVLYSASDRSKTVQATIHHQHWQARELELLQARGLYRDPPPIPPEEGSWEEPSEVIETTTRVWAAHPDRLRWESTFSGDTFSGDRFAGSTSVGVKQGELFWHRFGDGELQSNEHREGGGTMTASEERLLDPSPLLGTYRFDIGSPTMLIGRRGIEAAAHRRLGAHPDEFGPLADELALVVDEERGVLLRAAVVVESDEVSFSEITEIVFDEPIPPEMFRPLQ